MPIVQEQRVHIEPSRERMGALAASHVASEIRSRLRSQDHVRIIFAAAPSQSELLDSLANESDLDWKRVEAFHMDEYIGLPEGASQSFRVWLRRHFFDRVSLGRVELIEPGTAPEQCAAKYSAALSSEPIDIVCMGIGVNGHLAFNDPPADFNDSADVKIVRLDNVSRQQQVDEGLFGTLMEVPTHAITLTIPRLLREGKIFCCAPGSLKMKAVTEALEGPLTPNVPASILREQPNCQIYLDYESAAGLRQTIADARSVEEN